MAAAFGVVTIRRLETLSKILLERNTAIPKFVTHKFEI